MVMSSTYRQASTITTALLARDPENRLLARSPRFRLDAEMIRDQALSLSGLLVNQIGGPSVRPPQPDGLWFSVGYSGSNTVRFRPDEGADIYRRSVYTFWKRTSPPPQMTTFDAPSREECSARRERTNTPLQALVLMNEPQFVEASQNFALRAIEAAGGKPEDIATWLYRSATAKVPADADLKDLIGLFRSQQKDFAQSTEDARELISSIATQLPKGASAADMAAWTVVANVILNLDETINKG